MQRLKNAAVYMLSWSRSWTFCTRVERCVTVRDSNADIMMSMRIDSPDQLSAYLTHPKHAALAQGMKHEIEARMSFDAQD